MRIKYRNTKTGRIVYIDAEDPRVPQLDAGKRWERLDSVQPEPEPEPEWSLESERGDDEPTPAEVRAWARENDLDVPSRGRLSPEVVEQYKAARAG